MEMGLILVVRDLGEAFALAPSPCPDKGRVAHEDRSFAIAQQYRDKRADAVCSYT